MTDYFRNRTAILATMHRKEDVIAPILEAGLGLRVVVPAGLNTDEFGTFSRDRDRPGSQLETARFKAQRALELSGETLAIASEGSFAPHSSFPAACDRELVLLLDQANQLEIVGEAISLETNFRHQTIRTVEEAQQFATAIGAAHGLIVMATATARQPEDIIKGITTPDQLIAAVTTMLERSPTGSIHLETDMRALYNPTRMMVIAEATRHLLALAQIPCAQCATPGFAIAERRVGLPCEWCGLPTALTHSVVRRCQTCDFSQVDFFPDGATSANPADCSYCNP
jgi:hypothetical protein